MDIQMTPGTAWQHVELARDINRPTATSYIKSMVDDYFELHGDRGFADDAAIIGGIGRIDGRTVTIIGQEKGASTSEKLRRNFGCPHPEGYRKALRLMQQAEKFKRPVVCIVDTQGAYCGIGAEERGQGMAIAENLRDMMLLKVPVVSVLIGEGGSGGALAMAVADRIAMLENSVYSILSPEGFATILWKDSSRAREAAEVMKMTAQDVLDMGIIDAILPEPPGGAQTSPNAMVATVKQYIVQQLNELSCMSTDAMLTARYNRFRVIGNSLG